MRMTYERMCVLGREFLRVATVFCTAAIWRAWRVENGWSILTQDFARLNPQREIPSSFFRSFARLISLGYAFEVWSAVRLVHEKQWVTLFEDVHLERWRESLDRSLGSSPARLLSINFACVDLMAYGRLWPGGQLLVAWQFDIRATCTYIYFVIRCLAKCKKRKENG